MLIVFVAIEGIHLIGSSNPGRRPILTIGSTQIQDKRADYLSLGFSQEYHLTTDDIFVYGEFKVLGIRLARWEER